MYKTIFTHDIILWYYIILFTFIKWIHLNNLTLTFQEDTTYQNYFVNNFLRNNDQIKQ